MSKSTSPSALWRQFSERYQAGQTAQLITWSTIHVAPKGYEENAPYIVAIVQFSDKTQACVQLTDIDESDLKHGMKLRPVFRKMFKSDEKSTIPYGTKYTK